MDIIPSWLQPEATSLGGLIDRDRCPHAILICGPDGCGKRILALHLTGRLLDIAGFDLEAALVANALIDPERLPQHPDFRFVQPEPEKTTISINQIRELIGFLSLKSHQSGPKTAVIEPAQAMTTAAANSLLKTLEEPPGRSHVILTATAQSRLPATIVSRCRRVRVPLPERRPALEWLKHLSPDQDWDTLLDLAGGAPVVAWRLAQSDFTTQAQMFSEGLLALQRKKTTPSALASQWAKVDPDVCLQWLYRRIVREIKIASDAIDPQAGEKSGFGDLKNIRESLNIESSFADLADIAELRRLVGAGLNKELQLTQVLGRWYGGAQGQGHRNPRGV